MVYQEPYQSKLEKSRVRAWEVEVHACSYCTSSSHGICFLTAIQASDY